MLQLLQLPSGGGKLSEASWEARATAVFSEATVAGGAASTVDKVKLYNLLVDRRVRTLHRSTRNPLSTVCSAPGSSVGRLCC